MAQTQYQNTAKLNDITDVITNISPDETPVMSLIGRASPARNVVHSWMQDKLRDPKANAKKEGFVYDTEIRQEPKLLDNICQIFSQGYGVSKTSQAVNRKNIKDKLGYAMRSAMKECALDVEYALINNSNKVTGNDNTARQFGGLPYFITSNVFGNSGTSRNLTWDLINSSIESVKVAGGSPNVIVTSLRNKRVISALLPIDTTRFQKAESKKVVSTVDVLVTDFGTLTIMPDRWLGNEDVYLLDAQYLGLSYLRPFSKEELPNTSDNLQKLIVGELTFECRAEAASGRITDLNGTVPLS